MNDRLNIDKSIREKLDDFSVAPPAHVWDNIQGQMVAQQRKKRLVYIGWISAAAVVVFAFLAGWFFNEQSGQTLQEQTGEQTVQTFEDEKKENLISEPAEKEEEVFIAELTYKTKEDKNSVSEKAGRDEKRRPQDQTENRLLASVEKVSYELLESLEAIFDIQNDDVFLAERDKLVDVAQMTENDELLIAENLRNLKQETISEKGWIVGAHLSPGYSSHSVSHEEQYAQNMTYSADKGNGNVGGGFSVQYKTNKRLRVETGVYYSKDGQASGNSSRGVFGLRADSDHVYANPENVSDMESGFSNAVQMSQEGMAMNSTAGVVKMDAVPRGVMLSTSVESSAKYGNTLTSSGEFSQAFEFIEIPLYLRYNLVDKKIGVEIMGGFNAGFVVGNNAYIDNEFGKQNIGSIEDISTLNLSGTIGVGLNYGLGKHFSLAVEPRLNYYLSSINSNPEVNYRPYRIGVFTGIYYEF